MGGGTNKATRRAAQKSINLTHSACVSGGQLIHTFFFPKMSSHVTEGDMTNLLCYLWVVVRGLQSWMRVKDISVETLSPHATASVYSGIQWIGYFCLSRQCESWQPLGEGGD